MKISRVWAVYFSPTGNVKEVTNLIAKKLSEELSVPARAVGFYTSGQPEVCQGI